MNTATGSTIEALAVKRARFAEGEKVRYRVYRGEEDFIVVIAENALMAVKVSGITEPVRIVRDIPGRGLMESDQLTTADDQKTPFATQPKEAPKPLAVTHEVPATPSRPDFVPMALRELQKPMPRRLRILSAEEMAQLMTPPEPPAALPTPEIDSEPSREQEAASSDGALSPAEVQKLLNEQ